MKIVSVLLGIALVVVGGLAIHFSREVEAGRRQIAGLEVQLQERDARLAALSVRQSAPPVAAAAAAPPQAASPAAAPAQAASKDQAATTAAVQDLLAASRARMSSPEGMAQRRMIGRNTMAMVNPDIGEALGLTPEEAEKLLDLLAAHQDKTSEVFSSAAQGNNPASAEQRSAAFQAQREANEAELQEVLGSKYPQWQEYRQSIAAWQQRRDLRAVLDAGGIPMTDAQSKSLITALAAEQRSITQQNRDAASQGRPASEVMARYTPERRQRLLNAAAPHLTPQQLDGYRGLLERAAAQEQSTLSTLQAAEARAAAAAAAAPAPVPAPR